VSFQTMAENVLCRVIAPLISFCFIPAQIYGTTRGAVMEDSWLREAGSGGVWVVDNLV
jgi:hypothetical protein